MIGIRRAPVLLVVCGSLLFCGCQNTSTKDAIASYSYAAGAFSETVALRPGGRYVQTETQKAAQSSISPMTLKQTGTWRLLDRPDGHPLPLPASASGLPKDAVVELKSAYPFGQTFENQPPFSHLTDRTIPASEFDVKRT